MEINAHRKLRKKFAEWNRVLKITRKPDREEFTMSAKVTGAGIIIIGAIGFLIYLGSQLIEISMRGGGV
ncbi:MAG: protein translocase SEC61 complex subunit gamma [Candidatus Nanohaloarchaeota archaeon QJJ-7]|nr:protein translocase SEC61 complex subunit gamma [Candidatus Nanohaloarchaeota archaeon QJJ-7]